MNYKKHYLALCKSRQGLNRDCKTESHHITPRSMGGTDEASNLVDLTVREHYVAHKLLWKSNPTDRSETMALLALFNCVRKWKTTYMHPNFVKSYQDSFSYWHSGVNHPFFGKTKETHAGVAAMSAELTGRTKDTCEGLASTAAKLTGRTKESHAYDAAMAAKRTGQNKHTNPAIAAYAARKSVSMAGRNSPSYDPTIYHFKNIHTGKVAISDRIGMMEMYDIELRKLFGTNPRKVDKGWQLMSV